MVMVPQVEQPATGGQEFEREVESVKIERNSKGFNYSYRVTRKPGEDWEDVFRTIDMLESALVRRFGQQ